MINLVVTAIFGGACLLIGWKIGRGERHSGWIENTQRSHNESSRYFKVSGDVSIDGCAGWHVMLFTEGEVIRGISRAQSHPEDI